MLRKKTHCFMGDKAMERNIENEITEYINSVSDVSKTSPNYKQVCEVRDYIIKNYKGAFIDTLLYYVNKKKQNYLTIYKKAGLNRNIYSCIKKNHFHQVSKKVAIRFALALRLNLKEANHLLESAGYVLSYTNPFDLIIIYHITIGNYDIIYINQVLNDLLGVII